jgi:hypothetical protein
MSRHPRRRGKHASAAAVWTLDASWRVLLLELAADTTVDNTRSTRPAAARLGVIYTVVKGLDLDIGYQTRFNRAAPSGVLLARVTARWGLDDDPPIADSSRAAAIGLATVRCE